MKKKRTPGSWATAIRRKERGEPPFLVLLIMDAPVMDGGCLDRATFSWESGRARPSHIPSSPASRLMLNRDQVELTLRKQQQRKAERVERGTQCPDCQLIRRCCICACFNHPLTTRHGVTIVVHAIEVARSSSTHPLIARGLAQSEAIVWRSADAPDMDAVVKRIEASVATSCRTPCFLYPAAHAVRVKDLYATLSPSQQRAGLHIIAFDGTWGNVRPMVRAMPPGCLCVVVEPGAPRSVFSAARTQPAPGHISTAEAVACVLDEWRAAEEEALASRSCHTVPGAPSSPPPPAASGALTAALQCPSSAPTDVAVPIAVAGGQEGPRTSTRDARSCEYAEEDSTTTDSEHPFLSPVRPPGFLDPTSPLDMRPVAASAMYRHMSATRLRALVMTMVDAMCWQRGQLAGPVPPSRGAGFGTWTMGVEPQKKRVARGVGASESPAAAAAENARERGTIGPFSRVPAFIVRHIVSFVGPPQPAGYYHRGAQGNFREWPSAAAAAVDGGEPAGCVSEDPAARSTPCAAAPEEAAPPRRWGTYRWNEAPLPHLPPGSRGSALAACCTDMWYLECGRPSPSSRFIPWW